MKKIFNTIWDLFGWLIMGIICGATGYFGFDIFVIDLYYTPWHSKGIVFALFKYPGLIFFFFISSAFIILSFSTVVGFVFRLFGKKI